MELREGQRLSAADLEHWASVGLGREAFLSLLGRVVHAGISLEGMIGFRNAT